MRAIVYDRYGPPEQALQLREIDTPVAGDGEVLVGVHAAGIAIGDWLIVNGLPYIARPGYGLVRPKNRVAGLKAAGRVEAVGSNVTRFQPGDAVFGWCDGALAEYVAVPADHLVDKPDALSFEQAAAIRDTGQVRVGRDGGDPRCVGRPIRLGTPTSAGAAAPPWPSGCCPHRPDRPAPRKRSEAKYSLT